MTLNEKAHRLVEIKNLIKSLEKEKDKIESEFKEKGSFQTSDFDVAVSSSERFYTKGLEALIKAFGEVQVMNSDVVTKTMVTMVKVSKKQQEAA